MSTQAEPFICPECGSVDASNEEMVEPDEDAPEPWRSVLQRIHCSQCKSVVPAHIGERWSGMTLAEAKAEWASTYRKDNQDYALKDDIGPDNC